MESIYNNQRTNGSYNTKDEDYNSSILANTMSEGFSELEINKLELYKILIEIIGYMIIIINLMLLIACGVIIKSGHQPRSSYMHLGNTSLAHMYIGALAACVKLPENNMSHILCVHLIGMATSGIIIAVYSTAFVTVDRFVYILYNQYYRKWESTRNVRLTTIVVWILGFVFGYLPIAVWTRDSVNGYKCRYIKLIPLPLLVVNAVICFIPFIVMCALYYIILYHALKTVNQLKEASSANLGNSAEGDIAKLRLFRGRNNSASVSGSNNSVVKHIATSYDTISIQSQNEIQSPIETRQPVELHRNIQSNIRNKTKVINDISKQNQPSKWKAIKIVLFMTGSSACTSVPHFFGSLIYASCMNGEDPAKCRPIEFSLLTSLAVLGMINSLISPIVCVWWHGPFKRSLRKIILKKIMISQINTSIPRRQSRLTKKDREVPVIRLIGDDKARVSINETMNKGEIK